MFWDRIKRPANIPKVIRAGPLVLDRSEKRARVGGAPIELSPLLFRLLELVASRPGELVARQEIKASLWSYAERIDTERRLNTAMVALREALGDDAEAPRLIATVRGEGYRWIGGGDVNRRKQLAVASIALAAVAVVTATSPGQSSRRADPALTMRAQAAVDAWRNVPDERRLQTAVAQVENAERLAPDQPSILVLKAQLALEGRWDWRSAEELYRRALAIDPANADAKLGLAWLEVNRGDERRAMELAEQLLGSAVVSGDRRAELGWLLIRIGRPDLGITACTGNPAPSRNELSCAHTALAARGDFAEARRPALQLMIEADASVRSRVQAAPAQAGYAQFLEWRARHFLPVGAPWFHRAQVLADAGHREEALEALAKSIARHEPLAIKIGSSPSFQVLRSDPRFRQLAAQVGVNV